jgi:hypothetical protein
MIDLSHAGRQKSIFSSQSGSYVGVARNLRGLVAVRDSKEPEGTSLMVSEEAWRLFIRKSRLVLTATLSPPDPARFCEVSGRRFMTFKQETSLIRRTMRHD